MTQADCGSVRKCNAKRESTITAISQTPARTYTNTYLTELELHLAKTYGIGLVSSTVSNGSQQVSLASYQYDTYSGGSNCAGYTSNLYNLTGLREHDDTNYGPKLQVQGKHHGSKPCPKVKTCPQPPDLQAIFTTARASVERRRRPPSATTNYAGPRRDHRQQLFHHNDLQRIPGRYPRQRGKTVIRRATTYDAAGRPAAEHLAAWGSHKTTRIQPGPPTSTATTNQHWTRATFDGHRTNDQS